VPDGEDVIQEGLFQAYRKLDTFDEGRPLKPWLFQIAHNPVYIDFLRRRGVRFVRRTRPGRAQLLMSWVLLSSRIGI
jgi:DNA-directed RNA polymerase specialized sigma24 family protein